MKYIHVFMYKMEDTTNYMVDLDGHYMIIRNVQCHKLPSAGRVLTVG